MNPGALRELTALLFLGAWTGADTTAFLQIMVSQPVVAGWMGGMAMGQPGAGLAVGVMLQAVWARAFAMGGASFPVTGPAAVVGGAVAGAACRLGGDGWGALRVPHAAPLAAALAASFLVAEAGREAVLRLRRRRHGLVARAVEAARAGDPGGVVRANLAGLGQSALLGAGLTALGTAVGMAALLAVGSLPPLDGRWLGAAVTGTGLGYSASAVMRGPRGWFWAATAVGAVLIGWAAA